MTSSWKSWIAFKVTLTVMNIIIIIIIKMLDLKASHFSSNLKYLTICYTLLVLMTIRFTGAENRCKRTK